MKEDLRKDLEELEPEILAIAFDRLQLVGLVLAQIALIEVVADPHANDNSKVQAARGLTNLGVDPNILAERLRASPLANKSPEELRELVRGLRDAENVKKLAEE